jgi:hypothetical protein
MKPTTFTQAAPSAKLGKLVEFTQLERGQGTQHLEPLPVKSRGFLAQLRPPVSVVGHVSGCSGGIEGGGAKTYSLGYKDVNSR